MNKIEKPWGYYEVLESTPTRWIKKLTIKPNQRLSYQSHTKREEYWFCLEGVGKAIIEKDTLISKLLWPTIEVVEILRGVKHRIINTSDSQDLVVLEIAEGEPLEEDIIRYEDDYGRV